MKTEQQLWDGVLGNADRYNNLSEVLKALAHPVALQALSIMYNMPLTVTKIWTTMGLSKTEVSNRLLKLEGLKVLRAEKIGRERIYSIRSQFVVKLIELVVELLKDSNNDSSV